MNRRPLLVNWVALCRCSAFALLFFGLLLACGGSGGGSDSSGSSEAQQVAEAKAALAILYAPGDSASSVTRNVGLPIAGLNEVQVSWSSSTPSSISDVGEVIRPASGNLTVILTATLTKGAAQDTRPFTVIVLATSAAIASADAVQASGGTQFSGAAENTAIAGEGVTHTLATQPEAANRSGFQPLVP